MFSRLSTIIKLLQFAIVPSLQASLGEALFQKTCHQDAIERRKTHNCVGTEKLQVFSVYFARFVFTKLNPGTGKKETAREKSPHLFHLRWTCQKSHLFHHKPNEVKNMHTLVKLQLHDAIYRLRFYSNSLIHIVSLSNSHNNVASLQRNRGDNCSLSGIVVFISDYQTLQIIKFVTLFLFFYLMAVQKDCVQIL